MRQIGRVFKVTDGIAEISVVRESACGDNCASCSAKCTLKDANVSAKAIPGLQTGDMVYIEMAASKIIFAAFLAYITPIFALLLGFFIGTGLGLGEEASAGVGILAMVIWFFIVYAIDKRLKKLYRHTIVEVIRGEN